MGEFDFGGVDLTTLPPMARACVMVGYIASRRKQEILGVCIDEDGKHVILECEEEGGYAIDLETGMLVKADVYNALTAKTNPEVQ